MLAGGVIFKLKPYNDGSRWDYLRTKMQNAREIKNA